MLQMKNDGVTDVEWMMQMKSGDAKDAVVMLQMRIDDATNVDTDDEDDDDDESRLTDVVGCQEWELVVS